MSQWLAGRFRLDLDRPRVMGIVNVTPDSFSDGGRHDRPAEAIQHAERLLRQGADILDIGGESTRPGSPRVPLDVEIRRVEPVIREAVRWNVPVSIDTYKPEVMQACLDWGADIVNDVWALRRTGERGETGLEVVARHGRCGVCVMHMHLEPETMQVAPMDGDAVPTVRAFLAEQTQRLAEAGIGSERIVLDVGIGFGKTVAQNFALLARQRELLDLGFPLLAGWSRKSTLGKVTGQDVAQDRLVSSVTAAVLAVDRGARVVRVHDVAATVEALKVWQAMRLEDR